MNEEEDVGGGRWMETWFYKKKGVQEMSEDKSDTNTGVKDSGNNEVNGQCSNTLLLPAKY